MKTENYRTTSSNLEPIAPSLDLIICGQEPIHLPGFIQPHGVLLVLDQPELIIVQVSCNTVEWLDQYPQDLLNQPLENLVGFQQVQLIQDALATKSDGITPVRLSIQSLDKVLKFDGIVHRLNDVVIIELEPSQSHPIPDFIQFYQLMKNSIAELQQASTLNQMFQTIVKEIRQITAYDRVMVYQFDRTGAGEVIAEDKVDDLEPFLGLHYPASDVPPQARQLYTLNWLRLIPDVNYQPIALLPTLNPITQKPTDLSLSILRSTSPIHIEYLQNMGVASTLCISLIKNKKLWGMIACHHQSPKYLSPEIRAICDFLGRILSLELVGREEHEDADAKMRLKRSQAKFIASISEADNLVDGLIKSGSILIELLSAQGIAIAWGTQLTTLGQTPDESLIPGLLAWIEPQLEDSIFQTHALSSVCPQAKSFEDQASGMFALEISKAQKLFIVWFRSEVLQTVNWAGNPHKSIEVRDDKTLRFSPRKSFALWQEPIRGQALVWKSYEIDAVSELRSAIVGTVLRQADKLAKINQELERSNSELDAFAYIASHDLKEPLRGIHNYSSFLIEDYEQVLDQEGISKLNTLMRLTQRMEDLINSLLHFSRLGRVELSVQTIDLNYLVNRVAEISQIGQEDYEVVISIPRSLPSVRCDPIRINELFSNLISNAVKYNDRANKAIEIGYLDQPETVKMIAVKNSEQPPQYITFYVKDNGIGIREKHLDNIFRIFKRLHSQSRYGGGTGAGLTIARKVVERHGGEIWVESTYGEGSIFYFTLPKGELK